MKEITIDLSDIGWAGDKDHDSRIMAVLRRHGLLSKDFLYSVFNGDDSGEVRIDGTYRRPGTKTIFAFTNSELSWGGHSGESLDGINGLSKIYIHPAIVVYDGRKFEKTTLDYEYEFLNPDKKLEALVGIAHLKEN
jgi:hypothetical protein